MSRRRGSTITEVMLASSISTIVLFAGVGTFLVGMRSWIRGQASVDALNGSQRAVRVISNELREAMSLVIAGDGRTVTYQKPLKDANGNFVTPMQTDGFTRTISVSGAGVLTMTAQGQTRTLAKGLVLTDGGIPYNPFSAVNASLTRSLTVKLVSSQTGPMNSNVLSRVRETLYLRNVPQLSR